jgi:chromosome segregation ATPase
MALPQLALIQGGFGILSGIIGGIERRAKYKKQAEQLKQNRQALMDAVEKKQMSLREARQRIQAMIGELKGEIKEVAKEQLDLMVADQQESLSLTLDNYDRQLDRYRGLMSERQESQKEFLQDVLKEYSENLKDSSQAIKSMASKRRLWGEFSASQQQKLAKKEADLRRNVFKKQAESEIKLAKTISDTEAVFAERKGALTGETQRRIERARRGGMLDIANRLAQITTSGQQWLEGIRTQERELEFDAFQQMEQLQNVANVLEEEGRWDFGKVFGDIFKGFTASGAVPTLTTSLLFPEAPVTPTDRETLSERQYTALLEGEQPLIGDEDLTDVLTGREQLEEEERQRRRRLIPPVVPEGL